jgi:hypothetical protein
MGDYGNIIDEIIARIKSRVPNAISNHHRVTSMELVCTLTLGQFIIPHTLTQGEAGSDFGFTVWYVHTMIGHKWDKMTIPYLNRSANERTIAHA